MDAVVHDERRSEREGLSARRTDEWFLLRVDTLVTDQVGFSVERFATDRALKGLDPGVYVAVTRQVRRVFERTPADVTRVGAFPGVSALVGCQIHEPDE